MSECVRARKCMHARACVHVQMHAYEDADVNSMNSIASECRVRARRVHDDFSARNSFLQTCAFSV